MPASPSGSSWAEKFCARKNLFRLEEAFLFALMMFTSPEAWAVRDFHPAVVRNVPAVEAVRNLCVVEAVVRNLCAAVEAVVRNVPAAVAVRNLCVVEAAAVRNLCVVEAAAVRNRRNNGRGRSDVYRVRGCRHGFAPTCPYPAFERVACPNSRRARRKLYLVRRKATDLRRRRSKIFSRRSRSFRRNKLVCCG